MKRRFLSTLMALCLALSLLPTAAFAAERDEAPVEEMPVEVQPMEEPLEEEPAGPTASDTNFFANGTSITITASEPEGATKANFDNSFTAAGDDAFISWDDHHGAKKYVGVSENVTVWGGGDGSVTAVSFPSTSITMTGGTVKKILGGNFGQKNKSRDDCSSVTGDVDISITGGSVTNLIYGGGENNTCVDGTVTIELNNVELGDSCYVNGGVLGHGDEGTRDIENGTMTTYAVVNKVVINATDSSAYVIGGGGSGSTKVLTAYVTLNRCTVDYLYTSGINGEMGYSSLRATNCEITQELAATNRGFVKTAEVTLKDCGVKRLMTGATSGCFSSDSGYPDGSAITDSIVWNIDAETEVEKAVLTPMVKRDGDSSNPVYTATTQNTTIKKDGNPLPVSIEEFEPSTSLSTTVTEVIIPEDNTLSLNNVEITVDKGNTLTNVGTIDMDVNSRLTAGENSSFAQLGTVTGAGKDNISGDGVKKDYVARVGSTGYGTLQEAINNASSGATVTLLAGVAESVTIPETTTITLDLNGKKLVNSAEAQNSSTNEDIRQHTITNRGTLKVIDTAEGGIVDNVSHGRGALVNYGTATLEAGKFTRSAEAGSSPSSNGGNSWYVIDNHGTMTIDGATVTSDGKYSSLIRNISATENEAGSLTVSSGNLSNGFIALKNDTDGIMNITGGTITSEDQAVQNWSEATISGGELTGKVYSWSAGKAPNNDTGDLTISGNAKINGEVAAIQYQYVDEDVDEGEPITPDTAAKVTITGGTVLGQVTTSTRGFGEDDRPSPEAEVTVSNGQFKEPVNEKYLDESLNAELKSAGNTEAPYSYYNTVENALKAAQPGDSVTDLDATEDNQVTLTLKYNDGVTADSQYTVTSGTEVTLPTPTWSGYDFRYWSNGSDTYSGGASYTVTGNVTLTAQWSASSQGSSDSGPTTYSPTLDVSDGGTIKVSPRTPEAGDKVTITPDPDSGYEVDQVTVTDRDGDEIRVTANRDGTYTFTQPRGRVTIEVTFVRETGETTFSDVSETYWAYDEIEWAYDNGYVNGTSASTFAPGASISRQQVWMILARLSGGSPADMAAAREWAMANDISDGTNPGNAVTRQQLAALLFRFAQANGYDSGDRAALTGFPDAGSVASYAVEALQWATASGVINGTSQGALNPAGTATRAQFAVMLYRFWNGL